MPGSPYVRILLCVVLVLAAPAALAQAMIESVQYPAWIERAGESAPLAPGTPLQARDVIVTGPEGRARLRLAEGSRAMLGENARLVLQRDELALARGAVRLVTGNQRGLEVAVRVGRALVATRGADWFADAGAERDVVVLLEGRVVVGEGQASVALERPFERLEVPRNGETPTRSSVQGPAARWTQLVEMSADGAVAVAGGRWRVSVGKFESANDARVLQRNLHAAGFPAALLGPDRSPHVVVATGFAGESEARAAMARLRSVPGAGILTVSETPR